MDLNVLQGEYDALGLAYEEALSKIDELNASLVAVLEQAKAGGWVTIRYLADGRMTEAKVQVAKKAKVKT